MKHDEEDALLYAAAMKPSGWAHGLAREANRCVLCLTSVFVCYVADPLQR